MNFGGIQKTTQQIGGVIAKNSPTILTGLSVAGLITTVVFAVKATPKALQILENGGNKHPDLELTKKDVIKLTYKCYIPAALMGGVTIACIIGAHSINLRRNAALASMYTLSETALKEYQAKVVETIGEKKGKQIKDDIRKDKIAKNPVNDKEVIITGLGESLCYDAFSGRYFKGDIEKIRKTINDLNEKLMQENFIGLNEIYYELGLSGVKLGDVLGWDIQDGQLVPDFSSILAENGTPCLVVDFETEPKYYYYN